MMNYLLIKPKNEDLFEDVVCDIFAIEFRNPNLQRYGRRGQAQQDIDIVGYQYLAGFQSKLVAIQCKNHAVEMSDAKLISEFEKELNKFDSDNTLPIEHYIFITGLDNSAPVIKRVTQINEARVQQGKCRVTIHFWDFIEHKLHEHPHLLYKYYVQFLPDKKPVNLALPDLKIPTRLTLFLTSNDLLDDTAIKEISTKLADTIQRNLKNINIISSYFLYVGLSRSSEVNFDGLVDLSVNVSDLFIGNDNLETKYQKTILFLSNLAKLLLNPLYECRCLLRTDIETNFLFLLGKAFRKYKIEAKLVFKDSIWTTNQDDLPIVLPEVLEHAPVICDGNNIGVEEAIFIFNAMSRTHIQQDVHRNLANWEKRPKYILSYHLKSNCIQNAAHALSVAQTIASKIHILETWDVKRIHLFLVTPKPLAMLIGYHLNTLNSHIDLYFMGDDRQTYLKTGTVNNYTF